MSKTFKIVKSLHERLLKTASSSADWPETGIIGGINSIEKKDVVYCSSIQDNDEHLPIGQIIVGVFTTKTDTSDEDIPNICTNLCQRKTGQSVFLSPSSSNDLESKVIDLKTLKVSKTEVTVVDDNEFLDELMTIKVTGCIKLNCEANVESVNKFLEEWKAENTNLSFNLTESSYVLQSGNKSKCIDLYKEVVDDESRQIMDVDAPAALMKKGMEKLAKQRMAAKKPISFNITQCPADDGDDVSKLSINSKINCNLNIEIMSMVPTGAMGDLLVRNLTNGVKKQLNSLINFIIESIEEAKDDNSINFPKIYNFWPKRFTSHFITLIYPINLDDNQLIEERKSLLRRLYLPNDRPLIRKLNSLQEVSSPYLTNVHEGLISDLGTSGNVYLVDGNYQYHHYLQDKVNDNGWGCAYRSLQTIISWFRLQGYTNVSIPSHKEIQQALVDVGDKEPSFVGSNKWIGSQEVGYVLNQLLKVDYKTLFVSSGSELADKGRELSHHFKTNGTPIMVGGGQLAHTILGVHWNDSTGDIRFLILDPHYTGSEDLALIQKKGWCSWKPPTFWETKSFYNLCMPQRPNVF